jgi:hypothetical protein
VFQKNIVALGHFGCYGECLLRGFGKRSSSRLLRSRFSDYFATSGFLQVVGHMVICHVLYHIPSNFFAVSGVMVGLMPLSPLPTSAMRNKACVLSLSRQDSKQESSLPFSFFTYYPHFTQNFTIHWISGPRPARCIRHCIYLASLHFLFGINASNTNKLNLDLSDTVSVVLTVISIPTLLTWLIFPNVRGRFVRQKFQAIIFKIFVSMVSLQCLNLL